MINKSNFYNLIIGVLLTIAGIFVCFNPVDTLIMIALYLGIIFVFIGLSFLVEFFLVQKSKYLGYGLLNVILGFVFIGKSDFVATSMSVILALWILFTSVEQISSAIDFKKLNINFWKYIFASGILGLIFSTLVLTYPSIGAFVIAIMIGIYMISFGLLEVFEYFVLKNIDEL